MSKKEEYMSRNTDFDADIDDDEAVKANAVETIAESRRQIARAKSILAKELRRMDKLIGG
jgi:hypothetical protein